MALPLYLIGARGCGKTTIGEALAEASGYAFTDTDRHLQQATGRSVAEIVAAEGWEGFRRRETASLKAVTAASSVIATGGGMVLAAENRQFMREHGRVIYLQARADVLASRLEAYPIQDQRPTLTGRPVADEMVEVLASREALYRETAHYIVNAMQTPERVVSEIMALLCLARAG